MVKSINPAKVMTWVLWWPLSMWVIYTFLYSFMRWGLLHLNTGLQSKEMQSPQQQHYLTQLQFIAQISWHCYHLEPQEGRGCPYFERESQWVPCFSRGHWRVLHGNKVLGNERSHRRLQILLFPANCTYSCMSNFHANDLEENINNMIMKHLHTLLSMLSVQTREFVQSS